jgi:hypothetical protein
MGLGIGEFSIPQVLEAEPKGTIHGPTSRNFLLGSHFTRTLQYVVSPVLVHTMTSTGLFSYFLWYRKNAFQIQHNDHTATLLDYLADYQAMEQKVMDDHGVEVLMPELREIMAERCIDAFDAFTCYILSQNALAGQAQCITEVLPLSLLDHRGKVDVCFVNE